jgi:Protein of unknown function (DUF3443)
MPGAPLAPPPSRGGHGLRFRRRVGSVIAIVGAPVPDHPCRNGQGLRVARRAGSVAAILAMLVVAGCGGDANTGSDGGAQPSTTGAVSGPASAPHPTGTGTGALVFPPAGGGHAVPITVDKGVTGGLPLPNVPYVSVTVCPPGTGATTLACQTVDHILVDTMSSGLRILQSALSASLQLPELLYQSGGVGECEVFADGFTWGAVRIADIYIGGQKAAAMSIQDIGDTPGGVSGIPSQCSNVGGAPLNTLATLGVNGILGVSMVQTDGGGYFACGSGSCSTSVVMLGKSVEVQNPVMAFAQNNQGVVVQMSAIPASGGVAGSVTGTLSFGIGTAADNSVTGTETALAANPLNGYLKTTYKPGNQASATTYGSFFDTGSNALFFDDTNMPLCQTPYSGFDCPTNTLSLTATNLGYTGTGSGTVNFKVEDPRSLPAGTVAANLGAQGFSLGGAPLFDWGMPFFYGRKVFVVYPGASVTIGGVALDGPLWAY